MIKNNFPNYLYDELEEDGFKNLLNELIPEVYGKDYFIPGPSKGRDGGIDAQYLKPNERDIIFQYKFRTITTSDIGNLRSEIFRTFKKEITGILKRKANCNAKYIFITNVPLTDKYHRKFKEFIRGQNNLDIEYWEFEQLNSLLRANEDLYYKYFPHYTRTEIKKIRKRQDELERKLREKSKKKVLLPEFKQITNRLKDLFVDPKLKMKYYYAFIYLLTPFYIDERNKINREKLRKLFGITKTNENSFIRELKENNLIETTGALVTVKDKDKARENLSEMINKLKISLSKIVNLFLE